MRIRIPIVLGFWLSLIAPLLTYATDLAPDARPHSGFLANEGQWSDDHLFRIQASGFSIAFRANGLSFLSAREEEEEHEEGEYHGEEEAEEWEYYVWEMNFVGGNGKGRIERGEEVARRTNFMLGKEASEWQLEVPEYASLLYRDVWPGIDIRFSRTDKGELKYDFLLAAGANPRNIRVGFRGLENIALDAAGNLQLAHPWGVLTEEAPVAFTRADQTPVAVQFAPLDDQTYGFICPDAPTSEAWVIDPLLQVWSSYTNPTGIANYAYDVGYDAVGNLYIAGYADPTFPPTVGSYQTTHGGGSRDVMVAKFSPDGSNLLYMTYVGGGNLDTGEAIEVQPNGDVFVCGATSSTNFPSTTNLGTGPATFYATPFLFHLNSTGNTMLYASHLCSNCSGTARALQATPNGDVVVAGDFSLISQGTSLYPATAGAFQTTGAGATSGFVSRVNATGSAFVWSTYLGGNETENIYALDLNSNEEPIVGGNSASTNFPVSAGALQTGFGTAPFGGFITRLNAQGTGIQASTYFGINAIIRAIDLHPVTEEPYFCGDLGGNIANIPVSAGAFQTTPIDFSDAFSAKLDVNLGTVVYCTYHNGSGTDKCQDIAVNSAGESYVSGFTGAANFPFGPCQLLTATSGVFDLFILHLNPQGTGLAAGGSAIFGGNQADYNRCRIELREDGPVDTLFACGTTHSTNFPVTPGVFETQKLNGNGDTPLAQKLVIPTYDLPDTVNCEQDSIEITAPFGLSNLLWSTNQTTSSIWISQSGQYWLDYQIYGCTYTDTFFVTLNNLQFSLGPDTVICGNGSTNLTLNASAGNSWQWSTSQTTPSITVNAPGTYSVVATDTLSQCSFTDTIQITGAPFPQVSLTASPFCQGDSVVLDADPNNQYAAATFTWSNAVTTAQSTYATGGWAWVDVTDTTGCQTRDSVFLVVSPLPTIQLGPDTTICDTIFFAIDAGPGYTGYLWSNSATTSATTFSQTGTIWLEVTGANGCTNRDSLDLVIGYLPPPDLGPDTTLCAAGTLTYVADPNGQAPGATFLWSNNSTAAQVTVSNSTVLWLQQTSPEGCVSSDTVQVLIDPLQSFSLGPDTSICEGGSLGMDAGPGFAQYVWSDNSNGQTANFTPPNLIWVEVSDTHQCTTRDTLVLLALPAPEPDLGPDTAFCDGGSIDFAPLGSGQGYTFIWNDNSTNATNQIAQTGVVWVEATSVPDGCTGRDSVRVTVAPLPVPDLPPDTLVCDANDFRLDPGVFVSYDWNGLGNGPDLLVETNGTYSVTVTDPSGCEGTASTTVRFGSQPTPDLGEDIETCEEDRVTLVVEENPGDQILWSNGFGGPEAVFSESGEIWVEIRNECGVGTDTLLITFIEAESGPFIPNAFSPASSIPDNQVFKAVGKVDESFRIDIFDRWGGLIHTITTIGDSWDGTIGGQPAPEGVYAYVVRFRACDGRLVTKPGTVTLFR